MYLIDISLTVKYSQVTNAFVDEIIQKTLFFSKQKWILE